MELKFKKVLYIQAEVSDSEGTMFCEGGVLRVSLRGHDDEDTVFPDLYKYDEVFLDFRMESGGHFQAVRSDANKHRKQWDEIYTREQQEDILKKAKEKQYEESTKFSST